MQINISNKTMHFRLPVTTPAGEKSEHHYIAVTMMEEKGNRIGMGECAPVEWMSGDKDAYLMMSDVAKLINKATSSDDYAEMLRPYPALLFALESAMYDYQHSPLLYDTPFANSQVGIPLIGNIMKGDYDSMLSQAKQLMLKGFRCLKIDTDADKWDDMIRVVEKIRSRFSKEALQIRIDANGSLTKENALQMIGKLEKHGIHSVEQPLPRYQWKEMTLLCSESPVAIALDEELAGVNSLEEKRTLLSTIKPQYIAVRPMVHGGMAGAIEWISEAQKLNIGSWLSHSFEGSIGIRNIALLAARIYGANPRMPQDLEAPVPYTDNIEMDMEVRAGKLWRCEVEE